jgi:hypothetical protein
MSTQFPDFRDVGIEELISHVIVVAIFTFHLINCFRVPILYRALKMMDGTSDSKYPEACHAGFLCRWLTPPGHDDPA